MGEMERVVIVLYGVITVMVFAAYAIGASDMWRYRQRYARQRYARRAFLAPACR